MTLFYVWEGITVWAYWIHSFDTHLNYLGPVSCFSILNSPQVLCWRSCSGWKLWLKHSSYMKWQVAFFVHKQKLRRRPQVRLEREVYFSPPWDAPTCWVMEMENSCLQKCLSSITDLCPTWAGEAVSECYQWISWDLDSESAPSCRWSLPWVEAGCGQLLETEVALDYYTGLQRDTHTHTRNIISQNVESSFL